jgi:hypothetical protein
VTPLAKQVLTDGSVSWTDARSDGQLILPLTQRSPPTVSKTPAEPESCMPATSWRRERNVEHPPLQNPNLAGYITSKPSVSVPGRQIWPGRSSSTAQTNKKPKRRRAKDYHSSISLRAPPRRCSWALAAAPMQLSRKNHWTSHSLTDASVQLPFPVDLLLHAQVSRPLL